MKGISTFVEQITPVQRPFTNNRNDGDFEMIPYNKKNDHTTNENTDRSDSNQYILFLC